jgi:hypothetical protein
MAVLRRLGRRLFVLRPSEGEEEEERDGELQYELPEELPAALGEWR